ncbi:MAG: leucyl aminopeptidase [Chlamydiae bacterium]|nr:leucyl aminopeptidase [Chlamydiota bacterium]
MIISHSDTPANRKILDALVVPFWINGDTVEPATPSNAFTFLAQDVIKAKDFSAKLEETCLLYGQTEGEQRVILLGLGNSKDLHSDYVRRAYASVVKVCRRKKWAKISFLLPSVDETYLKALVEGSLLANYVFDELKRETIINDPTCLLKELHFVGSSKKFISTCKDVRTITDAVCFTRDLVNRNADDITPKSLGSVAKKLVGKHLKVHVLGEKDLEKEKMGLLLAVGKGSCNDSSLIVLEYIPDSSSKDVTAIVGKGITFDTGGLNLKVGVGIETMKCDMAGSASVLGVIKAASDLGIKKNIIGVIAAAENAIGSNSTKPGDVVISHSGKSVEINDTDAEGRLVLADALSYLQKHYSPSRIIDLATLTGGVVIALGEEATGLFSNDDALAHRLIASGDRTFERLWRLPLYAEYREGLKSSIADIKNSGGRKASAAKGAIFLQQFIKNSTPWAHLDIAGTAFLSEPKGYNTTAATGVGVRLLIDFLEML